MSSGKERSLSFSALRSIAAACCGGFVRSELVLPDDSNKDKMKFVLQVKLLFRQNTKAVRPTLLISLSGDVLGKKLTHLSASLLFPPYFFFFATAWSFLTQA
jgi:hypothetical protein